MKIRDFGVEIWMNEFENDCQFNLAETCVASLTVDELLRLAGRNDTALSELLQMKLTYGAIDGSDRLRDSICDLYARQKRENVIVTHGTIGANALIYETLVSPGDHVISVHPTYQQHYSIPESYGADVDLLHLREENAFLPDLDELRAMMRPGTRLIAINNPNNPTGSLMDRAFLEDIAKIAAASGAYVICDEVYRGIDQDGDGFTASMADVYDRGISTAGVSKVFSLAGLRLGWIAAPTDVIEQVSRHRDYNTISVGMLNDHFVAVRRRHAVSGFLCAIAGRNRRHADAWQCAGHGRLCPYWICQQSRRADGGVRKVQRFPGWFVSTAGNEPGIVRRVKC